MEVRTLKAVEVEVEAEVEEIRTPEVVEDRSR